MARHFVHLLAASAFLGAIPASAQTVQPTIATGANPSRIAVNPVTNTVYVTNESANTVSVIAGATRAVTTVPVGTRPTWIAANPETNKVYVSNFGATGSGPSVMVLNGATNTVSSTLIVGDVGWTAINQVTNKIYVERYGNADEVNIILDERYVNTAATRSYQPVSIALNPYTNILYIVNRATGDVTAIDASVDQSVVQDNRNNYPPLLCPNGSGGYKPSPGPTDPDPGQCINVSDPPAAVTVNPVTDTIYAASDGTSDQIAVIRGSTQANPHTFTLLSPSGVTGAAKAIAVNPVSNKAYAAFANHIVIVNGANNAMTVIPSAGPVAIGVNPSTNMIYVPHADGTLKVIDGATNAVVATLVTPTDARAIAVNPVTNMVYVVTAAGVTPVTGAAGSASIPLTTTITPLAGGTSGASGSITLNASASGGFASARRVYYQLDSTTGPWLQASGSGPYTAAYSGLPSGSHTIRAFATNALDAASIMTDVQNNPVVGQLASYTFTVGAAEESPATMLSPAPGATLTGSSQTFTWTNTASLYQVWVGSTVGANDLGAYPADGTTAPSITLSGLPTDGRTLCIRLYSLVNGSLQFRDYTYAAFSASPAAAAMLSPAPGQTLAGSTQSFTWSAGASVYQVWVGTSVGANDIGTYPASGTSATSTTISGLPTDGRTLCIRLYSYVNGAWQFRDYTYAAFSAASPSAAAMMSPAPGSALSGSTQSFTWTGGAGFYQVWVGTTFGASDLGVYPANGTTANSITISGLPTDGRTLCIRLYSYVNGSWQFRDYAYAAYSPSPGAATMLSPAPGNTLTGATQSFTWSAGASGYQLWVGTTAGANDIGVFPSGGTSATSTTVSGLPTDGRTLCVRLYSLVNATWQFRDFTYAAYSPPPSAAAMLVPAPGKTLSGSTQTFAWTGGASVYQVWVGNSVGANDIGSYPSGGTSATSTAITGLPTDGRTLYVRLYSYVSGAWLSRDYTYRSGP